MHGSGPDDSADEPSEKLRAVVGADGHRVVIPPHHTPFQGRDGRVVAVPHGSMPQEGPDGRIVAVAPGELGLADHTGRIRIW